MLVKFETKDPINKDPCTSAPVHIRIPVSRGVLGFTQRSQMTFYSTIRLRAVSAALKKSVLAYRAQWHEFLVGQGFNRPGDEGCLPDLPGYVIS
jgi:hypothetical protein